jgi:hypothetical protein
MAVPNPASLAIIRIAMGVGVLSFGVLAYVASLSRPVATTPAPQALTWAAWGIFGTALALLTAWRLLRAERVERGDSTTLIVGWAIGEAPALFGAAYLMVTGVPTLLLVGFVIYSAAMVLFPLPRR